MKLLSFIFILDLFDDRFTHGFVHGLLSIYLLETWAWAVKLFDHALSSIASQVSRAVTRKFAHLVDDQNTSKFQT